MMDNNTSQQEKIGCSEATFADIPVEHIDNFVAYENNEQVAFGVGKQSTDIREKFARLKTKAAPAINWMQAHAQKMGARNTAGVCAYWAISITLMIWLLGAIIVSVLLFFEWQAQMASQYQYPYISYEFNLRATVIHLVAGSYIFPLDRIGLACSLVLGIVAASKASPEPRKALIVISGAVIATGFVMYGILEMSSVAFSPMHKVANGMFAFGFIAMVVFMMWESRWLAIRLLILLIAILFESDIITFVADNLLFATVTALIAAAVLFAYRSFKIQNEGTNEINTRHDNDYQESAFEDASLSGKYAEQFAPSAFIPDAMFTENANDIINANGGYIKIERIDSMPKAELTWDEYFMSIALLSTKRSKDPNTQVGACIVSDDNRILSIGYNGAPNGFDDSVFPWAREAENELDTKYPFVVHAEENAILNFRGTKRDLEGAKVYVTLFPCNECAKTLVQSGIKEVIFLSDKYADSVSTLASKKLLDECGITYRQLKAEKKIELTI